MAMIPGLSHYGIGSIVQNMPRSCSSSSNKDGMLLKWQVHGQRSFIESIGGEESHATSVCAMSPTQYGFDQCQFSAILSGETNGHQSPLLLHHTTSHFTQHGHDATKYSVTPHPLWQLDFDQNLPIFPSQVSGPSAIPCHQVLYGISSNPWNVSHSSAMPCHQVLCNTSYDSLCH